MNEYTKEMPQDSQSEKLQEAILKKIEAGNVIRGIGVGTLTLLSILNIAAQTQNLKASEDLNGSVKELQTTVQEISGNVYDILEQGCPGNQTGITINPIPVNPNPISPQGSAVMKPVLYLYDDQPGRKVHTSLTLHNSDMLYMWPNAGSIDDHRYGWDMTTSADGTLHDNDGNEYSYIFWEASDYGNHSFDQGFCVKGSDTAEFLREKLKEMGLTPKEYNEFIVYWMPQMQNNPYNIIRFEGLDPNDDYNRHFELSVSDGEKELPDSMLRVFMVWQASDSYQELEPQTFTPFERNGFTVVEWGGTEVQSD